MSGSYYEDTISSSQYNETESRNNPEVSGEESGSGAGSGGADRDAALGAQGETEEGGATAVAE